MTLENCLICGNELTGPLTDFYFEIVCWTCGAPYQMRKPSGGDPDLEYPHIKLHPKFIPVFKEYWETTKKPTRLGMWLGKQPIGVVEEIKALKEWITANKPNWNENEGVKL